MKQFIADVLLFFVINLYPPRFDKFELALSSAYIRFREEPVAGSSNHGGLCYFFKTQFKLGMFSQFLLLGKKYSMQHYTFGFIHPLGLPQDRIWSKYPLYRYDRSNYAKERLETLRRLKLIKR